MSVLPFEKVLRDVSRGVRKIPQREFLPEGLHPIIDQGQQLVAGFSNCDEGLCTTVPAIVFGDHTRCVKFVDEPFVAGADGVKILVAVRDGDNPRYLYHALRSADIPSLGYSRHFKLVKELTFVMSDRNQQDEVVRLLDGILERRSFAEKQLDTLDELVKSRFVEMFGDGSSFEQHVMADLLDGIVSGTNVSGNQRPLQDGEFAVLKISAVTRGWFKADEYKVVDDVTGIRMVHPRRGDLLFSRANTSEMVGATAIVDCDCSQLFLPDKLWRLDPAQGVETVFLKQLLSSPQLRAEMSKVSTGTSGSMQNISMAKFRRLKAFLPPLALQQEFAAFVRQVDKLKFETQQAIDKLQMLYDSLAQEYFAID